MPTRFRELSEMKPPYCPRVRMRRAALELRSLPPNATFGDLLSDRVSPTAFVFVREAARSLGFFMNDDGGAIWNATRAGLLPDALSYAIEALETLGFVDCPGARYPFGGT